MTQSSPQFMKEFIALLEAQGLSQEQQKDVVSSLSQAVAINLVGRLEGQLSDAQKSEFASRKPDKLEDLIEFFKEKLSPAQLEESLQKASEAVIGKFLDRT